MIEDHEFVNNFLGTNENDNVEVVGMTSSFNSLGEVKTYLFLENVLKTLESKGYDLEAANQQMKSNINLFIDTHLSREEIVQCLNDASKDSVKYINVDGSIKPFEYFEN